TEVRKVLGRRSEQWDGVWRGHWNLGSRQHRDRKWNPVLDVRAARSSRLYAVRVYAVGSGRVPYYTISRIGRRWTARSDFKRMDLHAYRRSCWPCCGILPSSAGSDSSGHVGGVPPERMDGLARIWLSQYV